MPQIPDMPVEMPDDVSTLDVKFGGLDFGTAADEPAPFAAPAAAPQQPQPGPPVSESEPPAPFPPHARSPALGPLGAAAQTVQVGSGQMVCVAPLAFVLHLARYVWYSLFSPSIRYFPC